MNYDLIVIGGGPAGAAAAITASRGGVRVLLLERGRFPRHKVCGEFVSSESLQILHTLLAGNDSVLESCISISEARIFLDGQVITAPVHPPAASLTRFDLDYALWTAAEAAGVCTRSQTAVRSIQGDGPFELTTAEGHFQARAVVNASGRWSRDFRRNRSQRVRDGRQPGLKYAPPSVRTTCWLARAKPRLAGGHGHGGHVAVAFPQAGSGKRWNLTDRGCSRIRRSFRRRWNCARVAQRKASGFMSAGFSFR